MITYIRDTATATWETIRDFATDAGTTMADWWASFSTWIVS